MKNYTREQVDKFINDSKGGPFAAFHHRNMSIIDVLHLMSDEESWLKDSIEEALGRPLLENPPERIESVNTEEFDILKQVARST